MTCRSLLWIAAAAVSVGAATANPTPAGAQPDAAWTITIDQPATEAIVESKHLTIHGTTTHQGALDDVTVTVTPQDLPPQCRPATGPAIVDGRSYAIELDVDCNGPHHIQVIATTANDTTSSDPHPIGVAERPPRPAPPTTDVTAQGGLLATWDPSNDPDTNGTILMVDFREDLYRPGIGHATLPPTDRNAAVAIRTLRWGADGPGTTISSPESGGTLIAPNPLDPTPTDNPQPPPSEPPPPPADGPTSTTPSPNRVGTTAPSSTGAPSATTTTTVPAGPNEAQPAAATIAAWPETRPWSDAEERAVSTATAGSGLVRTTDERTPARAAPLALALLVITIVATGIAWRSRRARPRSWGNRVPPVHRRQDRGALWADLTPMAHAWTDLGRASVGPPHRTSRGASGPGSPRAARRRRRPTRRPRTCRMG